jgi:hypothetical protein
MLLSFRGGVYFFDEKHKWLVTAGDERFRENSLSQISWNTEALPFQKRKIKLLVVGLKGFVVKTN